MELLAEAALRHKDPLRLPITVDQGEAGAAGVEAAAEVVAFGAGEGEGPGLAGFECGLHRLALSEWGFRFLSVGGADEHQQAEEGERSEAEGHGGRDPGSNVASSAAGPAGRGRTLL